MNRQKFSLSVVAFVALLTAPSAFAQAQTAATPPAPTPTAAPTQPPPPADIDVGKMAPDFTLQAADAAGPLATPVKLSDLRGKVVVLAFYPADRSSGCTAELTKFRDEHEKLFGSETVVLPISVDSIATHASWAAEMKFPFALVSDPDLSVARQYGSYIPGRSYSTRTAFVIGKDGTILWRNLKFGALNEGAYAELAAEVAKAH